MAGLRNRQRKYGVVLVGLAAQAAALYLVTTGELSVPLVAHSIGAFQIEVSEANVEQVAFRPLAPTDGVTDELDGRGLTDNETTSRPVAGDDSPTNNPNPLSSDVGLGLLPQDGSGVSRFVVELEVSTADVRPVVISKTFDIGSIVGRPQYLRWSVEADVLLEDVRIQASPICVQAVIVDGVVVGDASSEAARSIVTPEGPPAPLGVRADSLQGFNIDLRTRNLTVGNAEFLGPPDARLVPTSSPSPALTCAMANGADTDGAPTVGATPDEALTDEASVDR